MNLQRMFIPKPLPMRGCTHCTRCRWCLLRNWRKDLFKLKNGPVDCYFCDADCAAKFVKYRHMIGVAHILKMNECIRVAYLDGMTLDDYISNGFTRKHAKSTTS